MSIQSTAPVTPPGVSTQAHSWIYRAACGGCAARRPSAQWFARRGSAPDMFLYPLFVCTGTGQRREVSSMPGVFQLSVDEVVKEAAAAKADGVPA